MVLPRLYAIADPAMVRGSVVDFVCELAAGGATLIQYRNKSGNARRMLDDARAIRAALGREVRLIMNDRADLAVAAGCDGVHVGQEDLSVEGARQVCALPMLVGVSTHNLEQLRAADQTTADYIAIGPVFATRTKENPDPVVGLEGVRLARAATRKPLVVIGGITLENCAEVIAAGADSVAVISSLIESPRKTSAAFLHRLM